MEVTVDDLAQLDCLLEGAGLSGGLVHNGLTGLIHQIEAVANLSMAPGHGGRFDFLLAGIAQIVGIVQDRRLVGWVNTCVDIAFQRLVQIDEVVQGLFISGNGTNIPVEGLWRQGISSTVFDGDILGSAVGIVPEVLCTDDAILQDIGCGVAVGVGSGTGIIEGDGFQHLIDEVAVLIGLADTDLVFRTVAGFEVCLSKDLVGTDLDAVLLEGDRSTVMGVGVVTQLQVIGLADGIHKVGFAGGVHDIIGDSVKDT